MGPGVELVAGRRIRVSLPPPTELDLATIPASGATIVSRARSQDVHPLVEVAKVLIGGQLAGEEVVRRVWSRQPDSLWAFFRDGQIVGGFAMFMLNAVGVEALLAGKLDASDPRDAYLADSAETPAGIYLWAIAHTGASDGIVKVFAQLQAPRYRSAPIFAAPVTDGGREFLRKWGFASVAAGPPNLFRYIRRVNQPVQLGG
jgi:hypothetical protein